MMRLTFVCLTRTSGLSRGLGRIKLTQTYSPRHTWLGHHFRGQKVKCQLAGGGAYCGGLPRTACFTTDLRHCITRTCDGEQSSECTYML